MRVCRLTDGAEGWAFQMRVPFTFDGVSHRPGNWIAEIRGSRRVVTDSAMRSAFMTLEQQQASKSAWRTRS